MGEGAMIDQSPLGKLVQELMERIEADHGDEGAKIGDACVIVEIIRPDGRSGLRIRTTPMPIHHSTGLLVEALDRWRQPVKPEEIREIE
jgi:hypothetical protein